MSTRRQTSTFWHDAFSVLSCLARAAAQFLKNVIPSHAVYDSKASVLFLLLTQRIVVRVPENAESSRRIPDLDGCN